MKHTHTILLASFCLLSVPAAIAEDEDAKESYSLFDDTDGAKIEFAYGTPASPALAIAGLKPADVTRVNEVRKFVASLPSAIDRDGGTALALDVRPGLMFDETLFDYTDESFFQRRARRSVIGLVVKEGKEDSSNPEKSTRSLVSLGLSTSLFDSSDPLYALFDSKKAEVKDRCHEAYSKKLLKRLHDDIADQSKVRDALGAALRAGNFEIRDVDEIDIYNENLRVAFSHLTEAHTLLSNDLDKDVPAPASRSAALPTTLEGVTDEVAKLQEEHGKLTAHLETKVSNKVSEELRQSSEFCAEAISDVVKFSSNLDIGLGLLWRGKSAALGSLEAGGQALWVSYSYPFGRTRDGSLQTKSYWVAGLSGRAGFSELVTTGDETLKESDADTLQAWAGIEYFSESWRLNARYGYAETRFNETVAVPLSNDGEKWLVGGDFRLGRDSNVWIGVEYGDAQGTSDVLVGDTLKVTFTLSEPAVLSIFGRS